MIDSIRILFFVSFLFQFLLSCNEKPKPVPAITKTISTPPTAPTGNEDETEEQPDTTDDDLKFKRQLHFFYDVVLPDGIAKAEVSLTRLESKAQFDSIYRKYKTIYLTGYADTLVYNDCLSESLSVRHLLKISNLTSAGFDFEISSDVLGLTCFQAQKAKFKNPFVAAYGIDENNHIVFTFCKEGIAIAFQNYGEMFSCSPLGSSEFVFVPHETEKAIFSAYNTIAAPFNQEVNHPFCDKPFEVFKRHFSDNVYLEKGEKEDYYHHYDYYKSEQIRTVLKKLKAPALSKYYGSRQQLNYSYQTEDFDDSGLIPDINQYNLEISNVTSKGFNFSISGYCSAYGGYALFTDKNKALHTTIMAKNYDGCSENSCAYVFFFFYENAVIAEPLYLSYYFGSRCGFGSIYFPKQQNKTVF